MRILKDKSPKSKEGFSLLYGEWNKEESVALGVGTMKRDACVIKGTRRGLSLYISDDVAFSEVLSELRMKLSTAKSFFEGASMRIVESSKPLEGYHRSRIEELIGEFGMTLLDEPLVEETTARESTMLVKRTIRSGQKMYHDGHLVVMGDVNPGAEIACGGDIIVLGALRGMAHAGVHGEMSAEVFAFRLEPTQLRIAQYISRAPDGKIPTPMGPEVASVVDDLILIRPYHEHSRKEL